MAQEARQKQLEEKKAAAQRAWDEAQKSNDKADKTEAEALQMGSFAWEPDDGSVEDQFQAFLHVSSCFFFVRALHGIAFRFVQAC